MCIKVKNRNSSDKKLLHKSLIKTRNKIKVITTEIGLIKTEIE
jgi:hypothetical protein